MSRSKVVRPRFETLEARLFFSVVRPDHVVVIIEEDRFDSVLGDTAHLPYVNQLAATSLVYTNSHHIINPGLPNYLALYSGSTQGITDNGNSHTFTGPNLAKSLNSTQIAPGQYLSFGGFTENLPKDGDTTTRIAGDPNNPSAPPDLYMRNYNPMAMFTDAGTQNGVAVPNPQINKTFASFPTTTAGFASLPTVSFVVPNTSHNTHGSNEQAPWATDPANYNMFRTNADTWLATKMDGYIQWAKTHNSILILTTDEQETDTHPSSTITTIITGDPRIVVPGTNSSNVNHFNVLRTIEDMYGLTPLGNTASLAGLTTNAAGQLSPFPVVNTQTATATNLAASTGSALVGQNITFTATVTGSSGVPTGTVTFMDGSTSLGTIALNGAGVASFSTTALSAATHSITAVYSGDTNNLGSTSSAVIATVANSSTSIALVGSLPTSTFGQSLIFTATISVLAPGTTVPTGTVTFSDGNTVLGSIAVNGSQQAVLSISTLSAGSHSITAVYNGDANDPGSTSGAVGASVAAASTSLALSSSLPATAFGQSVTLTATLGILAPGAGTPTGSVTFSDGATVLGVIALNAAQQAILSIASLPPGTHSITGVYGGDANFVTSTTASATTVTVNQAATTTTVTAPATAVFGQSIGFSATVAPVAPGSGVPTGAVQFAVDGVNFGGLVSLVNGVAVAPATSALAVGSHTVTALYVDDANFTVSNSAPVTVSVAAAGTSVALASSANPATVGQSVTFTATIGVIAPGAGVPTGTIQFVIDGVNFGSPVTISGSSAVSAAISTLTGGGHTITAVYSGDASFNTSTSASFVQSVGLTNDAFANRTTITGSSVSVVGSNVGATKESGEPNHAGNAGGKSTWWTWTAPSAGTVTIDTAGSSFDTLLAVYTGTSVSKLTSVASNNDVVAGTVTSKVTFAVTANKVYQIAVDGFGGASGTINLNVNLVPPAPGAPTAVAASDGTFSDGVHITWAAPANATAYEVWRNTTNTSGTATKITTTDVTTTSYTDSTVNAGPVYYYWVKAKNAGGTSGFSTSNSGYRAAVAPANDNFANRIVLTGPLATATVNNAGATKETGEPNHAGDPGGKSVWYTFTATANGTVTIDTFGSNFDTTLAVYTGTSVSALTLVPNGSNDDIAGQNHNSAVTITVTAGKTYQIAVDGFGGLSGDIVLHLKVN